MFGVSVQDIDGDEIDYQWSFGDGQIATIDNPEHVFSKSGTHHIVLTVADGNGGSLVTTMDLVVEDSDLNPAPDVRPLIVDSMKIAVRFSIPDQDSIQINGQLKSIPNDFIANKKILSLDVGGSLSAFTLDEKGHARSANGAIRLKLNAIKSLKAKGFSLQSAPIPFKLSLKKGAWTQNWSNLGFEADVSVNQEYREVPVTISLDNQIYSQRTVGLYSSKANKSASFKR
jgi:PKD repeat protein